MEANRQQTNAFASFKRFADAAVKERGDLVRLDCLNPIKAISHEFDFSRIPDINIATAWSEYLGVQFNNCFNSSGVRDSLSSIFKHLRDGGRIVSLPSDVYPVYQMLADDAGVKWTSRRTADADALPDGIDAALVTSPHVPTGKGIDANQVNAMVAWATRDRRRLLIVDMVYDYENAGLVQPIIDTNQAYLCYSLSKTHLSPGLSGFTVCPAEVVLHAHRPIKESNAKVLLAKYREFPSRQQSIFRYRWNCLAKTIQAFDERWFPPVNGYLSIVAASADRLLANGILAVPGNVYDLQESQSVVSCLHESNDFDGDRLVNRYHVTAMSNFARGYDKYSRRYSKAGIPESTFKDRFHLLKADALEVGFVKTRRLLEKTATGDTPIIIRTASRQHELQPNTTTLIGEYVDRDWVVVDQVLDSQMQDMTIEDAYAASMSLHPLTPWARVKPRSVSFLPIAQACQARCDFCFSHSSVSEVQRQGKTAIAVLDETCRNGKSLGANRLVITGGGEPTLLAHDRMLTAIRIGRQHFPKVVLITNGYALGNMDAKARAETIVEYVDAGLTVLAVSRHSHDRNQEIMKLDTKSDEVARTVVRLGVDLTLRWICVLQRQGVYDDKSLAAYLDWAVQTKASEVCFKELYVATNRESTYHDTKYNDWCRDNQVPLNLVVNFIRAMGGTKVDELPWGSPVYSLRWNGSQLNVAAYTEPSVLWERKNGICRSWNLMADGTCFANLETPESIVGPGAHRVPLALSVQ